MEKKNYEVGFMYIDGSKEQYETGEVTKDELDEFLSIAYTSFSTGKHGVLIIPNEWGMNVIIDVTKVIRISTRPLQKN